MKYYFIRTENSVMKKLKRLGRAGTLGTNTHHEARNGQCGPAAVGNGLAFPFVIEQTSGARLWQMV